MDATAFQAELENRQQRAEAVFSGPGRDALRDTVRLIAGAHVDALDYIEQAPVCVLIACATSCRSRNQYTESAALDFASKQKIVRRLSLYCRQRPRLRDFLNMLWISGGEKSPIHGLPYSGLYQLRKLSGRALRQTYLPTVVALAEIQPSTLSQLIPSPRLQEPWLRVINAWLHQVRRRTQVNAVPVDWLTLIARIAPSLSKGYRNAFGGEHAADFMVATCQTFGPHWSRWTAARFEQEMTHFHQMIRAASFPDKGPADYAPLPNDEFIFHGLKFIPLRTYLSLIEESRTMNHCVHSYWPDVCQKRSFIYAIRDKDQPVATLELQRSFRANSGDRMVPVQCRGHSNKRPPEKIIKTILLWLEENPIFFFSRTSAK